MEKYIQQYVIPRLEPGLLIQQQLQVQYTWKMLKQQHLEGPLNYESQGGLQKESDALSDP